MEQLLVLLWNTSLFLTVGDLRGPLYIFLVICRDGVGFYLAENKALPFSGRVKYIGHKAPDLFTYALPVKGDVTMTSTQAAAVLCVVVRSDMTSEPPGEPSQWRIIDPGCPENCFEMRLRLGLARKENYDWCMTSAVGQEGWLVCARNSPFHIGRLPGRCLTWWLQFWSPPGI